MLTSAARNISQTPGSFKLQLWQIIPLGKEVHEDGHEATVDRQLDWWLRFEAE
jgi:hypothetical protein